MRKRLSFTVILALACIIGFSQTVQAIDLYACMKKQNGQLRIVNNHSECKKSEYPLILSGTVGNQEVKLECYTAELLYNIKEETPKYCKDDYSLEIVNPLPPETRPKAKDIFDVICEAPPVIFQMDDDIVWGVTCKEGWMNTGCAGSSVGSDIDRDLIQAANGCFSDDEEYGHTNIFATCCRVVTILK